MEEEEWTVKTEVKTERDTQEPPLVRLPVSQCMTEQHSQEPEVKIEIDVAEEPPVTWYMNEQHSQVLVKPDFITESTASIKKEPTTKTQCSLLQESVKHSNRQVSKHIKSESRDAEGTTVVTGDTQFIATHRDEGAVAESRAMARVDATQLTRSPYNSQSPSSQDRVSLEGSNAGLEHLRERGHTTTKTHSCFRRLYDLKQQVAAHSGERPYRCAQCNLFFSDPSKLKRHMRIHTGERPYTCAQCNLSFKDSWKLKRHMRIHTGEKPHRCTQCNASFSRTDYIKRHMLTHTDKRGKERRTETWSR